MFNQLIESKRRKQKMAGRNGLQLRLPQRSDRRALSLRLRKAGIADDKTKQEKIQFVEMKKEPPKPKEPPPPPPPKEVVVKAPPPKGFQVLRAPVKIPIKIPDIDSRKKVTDEADFSGKGVKGGTAKGVVGGTPQTIDATRRTSSSRSRSRSQQIPGTGTPRYPDALRSSGVEGEVQAQFVVNEDGKADMQHVQGSEGDQRSVRARRQDQRCRRCASTPPKSAASKVKQLVQQSFQFKLDR